MKTILAVTKNTYPEVPTVIFNFYTYVFAAVTLVVVSSLIKKDGSTGHNTLFRKIYGYIIIMAACLFLNSYFKTLAAHHLDSVQLYPLSQSIALKQPMRMQARNAKITFEQMVVWIDGWIDSRIAG